MKSIKLFFIAIILFALNTNAQITKGNWMVGGNASFKTYKSENINTGNIDKNSYIELSPNFGYFFLDKFVVGAEANFGYTGYEGGANGKSYNVGPFARYYFLKPEKTVNFFTQVNFGYGEYVNSINSKYPTRNYGFKAGSEIFFNSSVGLEMALEYNKANENSTLNNSYYQFTIGFQIHLEK
jgi:hypothetical protein